MASKNWKTDSKIKYKNVQFWVSDLFNTFDEENPKDNDWISSVGIMGTVTDVYCPTFDDEGSSNRPIKYDLDDGTGVIKVVHFPRNRRSKFSSSSLSEPESSEVSSNRGFLSLLKRTENLSKFPFPIGSCVEAKGKVQHFRGNVELLAFQVRLVSEPRLEIERMLRLGNVNKKEIYPNKKT